MAPTHIMLPHPHPFMAKFLWRLNYSPLIEKPAIRNRLRSLPDPLAYFDDSFSDDVLSYDVIKCIYLKTGYSVVMRPKVCLNAAMHPMDVNICPFFLDECEECLRARGLSIEPSSVDEDAGLGVYAKHEDCDTIVFKAGQILCEYRGEILNKQQLNMRYGNCVENHAPYAIEIRHQGAKLFIDAFRDRCVAAMINHAPSPFCNVIYEEVDDPKMTRLQVVAMRDILNGEELLADYGKYFSRPNAFSDEIVYEHQLVRKSVTIRPLRPLAELKVDCYDYLE